VWNLKKQYVKLKYRKSLIKVKIEVYFIRRFTYIYERFVVFNNSFKQELSRKSDECHRKGFLSIAESYWKSKENESN
jgi:hypothetical protein